MPIKKPLSDDKKFDNFCGAIKQANKRAEALKPSHNNPSDAIAAWKEWSWSGCPKPVFEMEKKDVFIAGFKLGQASTAHVG